MTSFGWLKSEAVTEFGQEFSLQTALKRLDDRINAPADPAYLHPAYQAMIRLDQVPSVDAKRLRFGVEEEVVKSFAIYRLLGRSIHVSAEVEKRSQKEQRVVYVPEVADELASERAETTRAGCERRRGILVEEVGRVRKVLDDSYLPYGPTGWSQ